MNLQPPPIHLMDRLTLPVPTTINLSNGTQLMYIDGGTQDVNQLVISWEGGIFDYPNQNTPKLLAQLLSEGTAELTGAEVSERLDYYGAILNATSDSHHVLLTLTTLNSLTSDVLPLVGDIIARPALPQSTFETLRAKMAQNLQLAQLKVMARAQMAMQPIISGEDTPLGHIVTEQEIMSVDRDMVVDAWQQSINPAGCRAYLSGRLDPKVIDAVCRMLESLPAHGAGIRQNIQALQPQAPQTVTVEVPGAIQAAVVSSIPAPPRTHPDYVALRFATMALGGYFGSRLMKNIREDKGYTYGIYSALFGQKEGSYTMIAAQTDPSTADLLLEEVRAELQGMSDNPLSADEMERLRRHMALSLMQILDTPFTIMDHYRAIDTVGLPEGYFVENERAVREITPEQIAEVSARYLRPEQLRTVIAR